MNKYSYFRAPVLSFFSKDFYKYISNEKSGTGFGYLFLLLAICVIPGIVEMKKGFDDYIDNDAPKIISQIPEITIVNGEASITGSQPYIITDPDDNEPLIIIDTTEQITSLKDMEAKVLVSKHFIIFEKSQFETRTYNLSGVEDMVINQSKINEWSLIAKDYFSVTMYPFVLLGEFIWRVIQLLIFAAIGIVFVKILNSSNSYSSLLRLSVIAITPITIIEAISLSMGIEIPFSGAVFFTSVMVYLFFGVYSSRDMEPKAD